MLHVSEEIRSHYDSYYGDPRLARWRSLGAIDKAQNVLALCGDLGVRTLIDIGCGDGAVSNALALRGFAVNRFGVDISQSAISDARRKNIANTTFDVFDGATIPVLEGHFDLAVLSHVVEHLEYPRVLIREARRVAKHVFLEVPCEHTIRLPRDFTADSVGHINFYTPKTIRRLVQTCGLTVDRELVTGSSLPLLLYQRPLFGYLQYALRATALAVVPTIAPAIFVYHSALLCH